MTHVGHALLTHNDGQRALEALHDILRAAQGEWVCVIDDASEDDTWPLLLADHKARAKAGLARASIIVQNQVTCGREFCWSEAQERMEAVMGKDQDLTLRRWAVRAAV